MQSINITVMIKPCLNWPTLKQLQTKCSRSMSQYIKKNETKINDNYVSVSHGPCTESGWLYTPPGKLWQEFRGGVLDL